VVTPPTLESFELQAQCFGAQRAVLFGPGHLPHELEIVVPGQHRLGQLGYAEENIALGCRLVMANVQAELVVIAESVVRNSSLPQVAVATGSSVMAWSFLDQQIEVDFQGMSLLVV
jgi:hypothetical protein